MDFDSELDFHRATELDQELLLMWANEDETRKQSFQQHRITQDEHEKWFQAALQNRNIRILIFCVQTNPVGNIRFQIDGTYATLSYSIDWRYRGKGLGKKMIEMAADYARECLGLTLLRAEVKPDNIASQKVLSENGFVLKREIPDSETYTYIKRLTMGTFCKEYIILFRTDGNPQIGTGHVMRCLSLADAFCEQGVRPVFVTAEPHMRTLIEQRGYAHVVLDTAYDRMEEELPVLLPLLEKTSPSCMILDSYFVTPEYMRAVHAKVPLVYIDDQGTFDYPADAVVNYNLYGEQMAYPPNKTYLLGPRYAPLRKQFAHLAPRIPKRTAEQILISTGGTDQYHVALRCAEYLREQPPASGAAYHFILGTMNPDTAQIQKLSMELPYLVLHQHVTDMRALMLQCDAAVSAAGTTLYELCACGLPTVTYILADNQIHGAASFEAAGLMPCAGDIRKVPDFTGRMFTKLGALMVNHALRLHTSRQMQAVVDGRGAERLAEEIRRIFC